MYHFVSICHSTELLCQFKYNFYSHSRALGFQKDIAIIELAQRITFDEFKQPAALAQPGTKYDEGLTEFEITGWGSNRERGKADSKLNLANALYINFEKCKETYVDLGIPYAKVTKGMLCAGI